MASVVLRSGNLIHNLLNCVQVALRVCGACADGCTFCEGGLHIVEQPHGCLQSTNI